MLSATFAGMEGSKVDGSWSGFADDLFIKDEIADHTAETAKDIILDETLAEDRYKQNLRKLEIVPSIRRYGEQGRLTSGKILGRAEASRREKFIQREQQNGNRLQAESDDGELDGTTRVLVRTFAMERQTIDFPVLNCERGDNGKRRIRGITE